MTKQENNNYRAGYLGLIGFPNAGKSSLMNCLVEDKISIVTDKVQTTRKRVEGVVSIDEGQLVLVDTPGVVKASKGLNQFLQKEYESVIQSVDALVAVLNLDAMSADAIDSVLDLVVESKKPWMALMTKTDLLLGPPDQMTNKYNTRVGVLEQKIKERDNANLVGEIERFSHKGAKKDFLNLTKKMVSLMPESPSPLYPVDMMTTQSMRDLACEIVREKCFEFLYQELPYELAVRTVSFKEDGKLPKIHIEIVLNKENQKNIVIGKNGSVIKKIGTAARQDIEKTMGEKVFLDLHVVVRKEWVKNKKILKELGYDIRS